MLRLHSYKKRENYIVWILLHIHWTASDICLQAGNLKQMGGSHLHPAVCSIGTEFFYSWVKNIKGILFVRLVLRNLGEHIILRVVH